MRYAPASLLVVLLAGAAAVPGAVADEAEAVAPVRITLHVVEQIRSPQALSETCGSRTTIRGCTRFFGRQFNGGCSLDGEAWKIDPRAQFGVKTYIAVNSVLAHEYAHIRDVEDDVAAYAARIGSLSFDSKEDCLGALREAAAGFAAAMDVMQGNSNATRHPERRRPESVTTRVDKRRQPPLAGSAP